MLASPLLEPGGAGKARCCLPCVAWTCGCQSSSSLAQDKSLAPLLFSANPGHKVSMTQDSPLGNGTIRKAIPHPSFTYTHSFVSLEVDGCINETWHASPPEFKDNEYTGSVPGGGEHPEYLNKQLLNVGAVPRIL